MDGSYVPVKIGNRVISMPRTTEIEALRNIEYENLHDTLACVIDIINDAQKRGFDHVTHVADMLGVAQADARWYCRRALDWLADHRKPTTQDYDALRPALQGAARERVIGRIMTLYADECAGHGVNPKCIGYTRRSSQYCAACHKVLMASGGDRAAFLKVASPELVQTAKLWTRQSDPAIAIRIYMKERETEARRMRRMFANDTYSASESYLPEIDGEG